MSTSQIKQDRLVFENTMAAMFSNKEYNSTYLFYAHIVGQCSVKIERNLPAAAGVAFMYDHYNLYINPDLFDKEPLVQRLGIIKHEMLHILNRHVLRSEDRIHKPWNYATDCAINQLIERSHLPDYVVYPDNLGESLGVHVPEKESSEFYYELIKENSQQDGEDGQGQSGDGEDGEGQSGEGQSGEGQAGDGEGQLDKSQEVGSHDVWNESKGDKDLQKDITKKMIEHAQKETVKGKGNLPQSCSDWLQLHTSKSEVNWKKVVRGIAGNKRVGSRSTIMRSDRRFPSRDDLRGKTKERMFNFLVIADVSGSMSDEAVLKTLGEVRHVCDLCKSSVDLIQIDTVAYKPEKLEKKTKLISRKGHGGTRLSPALDMAKEHKIDYQAVIVLTDGGLFGDDVSYFKDLNKKVVWLIEPHGDILPEMNEGKMVAIKLKG